VTKHENFVPKDRSNRTIPLTKRFAEFLRTYLAGRESNQYVLAPEKTNNGATGRARASKKKSPFLKHAGVLRTDSILHSIDLS
jgi:hypothetical protein